MIVIYSLYIYIYIERERESALIAGLDPGRGKYAPGRNSTISSSDSSSSGSSSSRRSSSSNSIPLSVSNFIVHMQIYIQYMFTLCILHKFTITYLQ